MKHLYPCFIAVIKYGYEFRTSIHTVLRDRTRVHMCYFDSNTTVSLQCLALVCLESLCWQGVVWLTVPWDPNKISMNVFRYFSWCSIQLLQRRFCGAQTLLVFFCIIKTFQMCVNLLININVRNTQILFTL